MTNQPREEFKKWYREKGEIIVSSGDDIFLTPHMIYDKAYELVVQDLEKKVSSYIGSLENRTAMQTTVADHEIRNFLSANKLPQ